MAAVPPPEVGGDTRALVQVWQERCFKTSELLKDENPNSN